MKCDLPWTVAAGLEGAASASVTGIRSGREFAAHDWLAEEVPVALEFNGISHAVMLATPLDLKDFALGFSLSEAIFDSPRELYGIEEVASPRGITLQLEVSGSAFARLKDRRRSMAGRSGCGLCGSETLAQVTRSVPQVRSVRRVMPDAIALAMAELVQGQALQQATGATHAAAWCDASGRVHWLREDVGRHNALDKLIGALATAGVDATTGFIAITSRASFEMVQKAAMAGVPLLAAISAPTSLAVKVAQDAGLTLIGFARDADMVVYSRPDRIAWAGPAST